MARIRKSVPSYLKHSSGQARAVWSDALGIRHFQMLPGEFGSPESKNAYSRLVAELALSPIASPVRPESITVVEVFAAYLEFAAKYYTDPDGKPTKELIGMKASIKPARELYADVPAASFGPVALRTVRQKMIDEGLCRSVVNHRTNRIKRVFRWAASEELIPVGIFEALRTLAGLRRGRSEAPEPEPIKPVAEELVQATLPYLPPHPRCMVELMYHTGMRPSEAMPHDARPDRPIRPNVVLSATDAQDGTRR